MHQHVTNERPPNIRHRPEDLQSLAAEAARLAHAGLKRRDIATVLGISETGVSQLDRLAVSCGPRGAA